MTRSDVLSALPIQRGHFLLESGYHSNTWLSLAGLFVDTARVAPLVTALAAKIQPHRVTAVCGPMLGGAFLAQAIAHELGVRFYFATGPTQDADGLFSAAYQLPAELAVRVRAEHVALVDDVISAGSSVRATKVALDNAGARTVVVATLLTLGDTGRSYFESQGIPLEALGHREFTMWKPGECPLCAAGGSLSNPQA